MTSSSASFLSRWARVAFETPPEPSHFFGYYDRSPLSADGNRLLSHQVTFDGRAVEAKDRAEIGYYDINEHSWRTLGETRAFNWQQGAMLQWLGPDFLSRVIFNDQEGCRFVSRIVDLATGRSRTVPHAVYVVHPSGRSALGVRFERHYFSRAYHYEGVREEQWNVPIHPDDGILAVDLESGTAKPVLRTADIAAFDPTPDMSGKPHWLEHLMWNPSGKRFCFLHRYGSNEAYSTRVFTTEADGTGLYCLPGFQEYCYTHMSWRDEQTFVVHATKQKPLAKAYSSMIESRNPIKGLAVKAFRKLKGIIPSSLVDRQRAESGYALVNDKEGRYGFLSTGLLRRDGHPGWTRDGRFMLTDTYADEAGFRHLLLYDAGSERLHTVGRFFSPYNNCSYRCDLHPRFSRDERQIIIDTAHSGRHQMLVLDIAWDRLGRA